MLRFTRCFFLCLTLSLLCSTSAFGVNVGDPAPEFSIKDVDGEVVDTVRHRGESPLLVLFWATWCPTCQEELPRLAEMYPALREQGLEVIAINVAMNDSLRKTRFFQQRHALNFPLAFDGSFEISRAFEVRGVPTVFLIDSEGKVRYRRTTLPQDLPGRVKSLKKQ